MSESKSTKANKLKAAFNVAWDAATKNNEGALSYRDMTRICDAVRYECPKILGLSDVPKDIEAGLAMACGVVNPSKARLKETLKILFGMGAGGGGLGIAGWGIFSLIHPGVWAAAIAFFGGGIAGGPLALIAVPAGITLLVGALYVTLQKMTPKERAAEAHKYVMEGIDRWQAKDDKL